MISRLLFEKLVERREISTETNGQLSCLVIVHETRVSLDHRRSSELRRTLEDSLGIENGSLTICKRRSPTVCLLSHWVNFWEREMKKACETRDEKRRDEDKSIYRVMNVDLGDFVENIVDQFIGDHRFVFHRKIIFLNEKRSRRRLTVRSLTVTRFFKAST